MDNVVGMLYVQVEQVGHVIDVGGLPCADIPILLVSLVMLKKIRIYRFFQLGFGGGREWGSRRRFRGG